MALQQNRTSDTTPAFVYSRWARHTQWTPEDRELFHQDLKALYELGKRDGYDNCKKTIQLAVESL